jgi:protein FRA10AC1
MIEREFKQEIKLIKTDLDILKENFKFIWEKNDKCMNENENDLSWEETFAKRYYDKLYKEYCIANLTYYKEGKYRTNSSF